MVGSRPLIASLKRKSAGYSRYSREHPHIARNLTIDAVLSMFSVVLIFTYVNNASASTRLETLRRSGAVSMTAEELIKHVQLEKISPYWFGPIEGTVYTIICTDPGEILISYLPAQGRLHDSFATAVSVETYTGASNVESILGSNAITDPDDYTIVSDEKRTMAPSAAQFMKVNIPGTDQKVEIHYPTLDSSLDARMQPDQLRLVK